MNYAKKLSMMILFRKTRQRKSPLAKLIKNPPKSLSELEQNWLLREVYKSGNKRDITIVELMVGAGLRIGEVVKSFRYLN